MKAIEKLKLAILEYQNETKEIIDKITVKNLSPYKSRDSYVELGLKTYSHPDESKRDLLK